jgi:2-polyprenyl-3-methyl-5-hydroxy-6-metoxy-1,4-benzoquinol methylase
MPIDEYRKTNIVNWNERTAIHAESKMYDVSDYISDPKKLSEVVKGDLPERGDLDGKSLLHLQCHIGTDTISFARLGATVTGIDFSPDAIATAWKLSDDSGTPARFLVLRCPSSTILRMSSKIALTLSIEVTAR